MMIVIIVCRAILTLSASDETSKAFAMNGGDSAVINAMLKHRYFHITFYFFPFKNGNGCFLETIQEYSNLAVGHFVTWPFQEKICYER